VVARERGEADAREVRGIAGAAVDDRAADAAGAEPFGRELAEVGGDGVVGGEDQHGVGGDGAEHAEEAAKRLVAVARGAAVGAAARGKGVAGQAHVGGEGLDRRRQRLALEAHLVHDVGDGGGVHPRKPPGEVVGAGRRHGRRP